MRQQVVAQPRNATQQQPIFHALVHLDHQSPPTNTAVVFAFIAAFDFLSGSFASWAKSQSSCCRRYCCCYCCCRRWRPRHRRRRRRPPSRRRRRESWDRGRGVGLVRTLCNSRRRRLFPAAEKITMVYWVGLKGLNVLLSRTQAGPGRAVKQEQEENSHNHVRTF